MTEKQIGPWAWDNAHKEEPREKQGEAMFNPNFGRETLSFRGRGCISFAE